MRMNHLGRVGMFGVILAGFFAGSVLAGTVSTVKLDTTAYSTTGGPFQATVESGVIGKYTTVAPNNQFQTFCVEVNEDFYPGATYYAVVSDRSVMGTGSVLDPIPHNGYVKLQSTVAFLYTKFMNGTLSSLISGWTDTPTNTAKLDQSLQNAIWYFMGYQNYNANGGDGAPLDMAHGALGNGYSPYTTSYVHGDTTYTKTLEDAAVNAGWTNNGDVAIMQMWNYHTVDKNGNDVYSGIAQDQLVMLVPTPTASMAGLSLLGGLGLVGWIKRRRNVLD